MFYITDTVVTLVSKGTDCCLPDVNRLDSNVIRSEQDSGVPQEAGLQTSDNPTVMVDILEQQQDIADISELKDVGIHRELERIHMDQTRAVDVGKD
jgi:hypothetical protein